MASSVVLAITSIFLTRVISSIDAAITVDLIDRDSENSPLYNASETSTQRLSHALARSINRIPLFGGKISTRSLQTDVADDSGQYLMRYHIGTPPFEILALLDTHTELLWIQCLPCTECYAQNKPIFNPKKSSSFIPCKAHACTYDIKYFDGTRTSGYYAYDLFTIGDAKVNVPFGCSNRTRGDYFRGTQGVVGLNHRGVSLLAFFITTHKIDRNVFSYCLVPLFSNHSSKMTFGTNALVAGAEVVSTPLIMEDIEKSGYYFVRLEAISIKGGLNGDQRVKFFGSKHDGNMILDSGTVSTIFPADFLQSFLDHYELATGLKRVPDPLELGHACYDHTLSKRSVDVIYNFKKADLKMSHSSLFIDVTPNISCFGMIFDYHGEAIYGSMAQVNFFVQHDLEEKVLSFKPYDCLKVI